MPKKTGKDSFRRMLEVRLEKESPSQITKSISEQAERIKKANKRLFDRLAKL